MALEPRSSRLDAETHSMLNSSNYDTLDNENNNNNNDVKSEKCSLHREDTIVQHSNAKGVLAQCLVTGAVLLLVTGGGMPIGYSAVLLPQLSRNNDTFYVDREVGSWIASVHSLMTPVGSLLSGPLLDVIGRRGSLLLCAIPLCVGWLIIAFSRCVTSLLIGRLVCGLFVGMMAVPVQVLVGEMAYPALRGFLVVGSFAAYCFGILLVYGLGASFNWDVVAFCGTVPPILAFIALFLVPESPAWLVRRRKIEKAKEALLWLRGGDIDQVNAELAVLNEGTRTEQANESANVSLKERIVSAVSMMRDPGVMKPFIIINIFNILQLCSGTYIIVFYAVDIIKDIGGGEVDNYLAAVMTAAIRFIFSIVSCVLLLKMGRRPLGMISALGTCLASLTLAGYMILRQEGSTVDVYVLAVCLLFYVGANTLGILTLSALISSELMPLRARGIGNGCIFFVFNVLVFLVTKCFPWVSNAVGVSGVFAMFGLSALLETIFIYIALPETKDCTLQKIENYFQQSNLLWITRTRTRDAFMPVNISSA